MQQPMQAEDPHGAPLRVGTDDERPNALGVGEPSELSHAAMQFKGDGEQRMVEIIKCVMQYNDGAIFEWGKKEKTLKEAQEALNGHPVFAGQLKLNT